MNVTDIIIAIILVFGAYQGFKTGFIVELIGMVAFILAIIGGLKLLHVGMEYLDKVWDGFGTFLPFIAFIVIFVIIIILVNLIGQILKKTIDWTPLGVIDNFAGAVVGALKMAFAIGIILWIMTVLEIYGTQTIVKDSKIVPWIQTMMVSIKSAISTVFPSFDTFIDTLRDLLKGFAR